MSEMIELGLLHEEHFRKNPISGTVVQHLSIDAEMDQRLASEHGAERLRNTLSSPDFQTNICGEKIFLKLLAAFREDHAVLGHGFNELSCCLRAADILGAARAAQEIYEEAGPHICFEEEDFYPALVPLLGEQTVRKMRQEHCCGFDAVRTLLNRRPDLPLPADLSKRLLAQSEVMEAHIAECGDLFAALHDMVPADQQALYNKLMKWRQQQPKLDLDRRTVGCGALRLVQCHPAALPLDASRRSSLPIAKQLTVQIGAEERRELARLASRLIADEPALIANDTLDPRTGSGIADGPALFFERPQRNRFLAKALRHSRDWKPHIINTDRNPAYGEAIAELKKEGLLPKETQHRQVKYLNNRLEGDHGKLKRLIKPTLGFQSMKTAYATLKGFEVMRMFKKGQFKLWIEAVGGGTEASFVNRLFGVYA